MDSPIGIWTQTKKWVGEGGKSVSWGGARTKGKGRRERERIEEMFSLSDTSKGCFVRRKNKRKIDEFFPDATVFYLRLKKSRDAK